MSTLAPEPHRGTVNRAPIQNLGGCSTVNLTQPGHARPSAVPVCDRCRRRKQKCTNELHPCPSCIDAAVECSISDPDGQRSIPRTYVLQLEEHRARLQKRLESRRLISSNKHDKPHTQSEPRASIIAPTGRYLGSSSGIAFVESAILLAKKQGILQESDNGYFVREPPEVASFLLEDLLPPPTKPTTPPRHKLEALFTNFTDVQWQYNLLNRSEFDRHLTIFYGNMPGRNPASGIVAYMVLATTLHFSSRSKGNIATANMADTFHEEALALLVTALSKPSLDALQALLLVLVYSIVNPQKPLVWHLLGRAWRLALALHLHTEEGCRNAQLALSPESKFLPKRLFWSLYAMDRGVSNTLGRPAMVQDDCITTTLPPYEPGNINTQLTIESNSELAVAVHFYRIRQLNSEVADFFYQRLRNPSPTFTAGLQRRIDQWRSEIFLLDCAKHVEDWFQHSYHNVCIFLYRPSPANPQPSAEDLDRCFEAASQALKLYSSLYRSGRIDSTWIAVHWLVLAAITHLFCLWSSSRLRASADWNVVNENIQETIMVLAAMTERWRSAQKILEIYCHLTKGTLQRYAAVSLREGGDDLDKAPEEQTPSFAQSATMDLYMNDLGVEFGLDIHSLVDLDPTLYNYRDVS